LARANEFVGTKLYIWSDYHEVRENIFTEENPLWPALAEKGFDIVRKTGAFQSGWLSEADQLWIFAGDRSRMSQQDYQMLDGFIAEGKGVYLVCDNEPYLAEVADLARRLYGVEVRGNYFGTKIAYVRTRGLSTTEQAKYGAGYEVADHPLFSGLNFIYEGITISHIEKSESLKPIFLASDGTTLAAASREPGQRVIIDCGYTRYFYGPTEAHRFITKTAGTVRYAQNVAAYLMGNSG